MSDALKIEIKSPVTTDTKPAVPPVVDPNRPAWLPEKFKTAEDFAAAYVELEKKQTVTPPATTDLSTADAAKAALASQGLDFQKLSNEYTSDGKLSADSMAALKAKGFTEAQVAQFVSGQEAIARENTKSVQDAVGGAERLKSLMEFAKTAFSVNEVKAYNEAVNGGNYDTAKLMLQGLNVQFEKTFGKDGNLTTGGIPNTKVDMFENFQDYRNSLKDPRYQKDRNYRDAVDAKLARSTFFKSKSS